MHRLIRMVQVSSRRGFFTHGRMGRLKSPNLHKRRQISLSEFQAMCEEGRTVVAYQGELYDMSDFSGHPGGVGRLQMASGGDLEVYWKVYTQHNRGHVKTHMERYKIGEVSPEDMATITANTYYDSSVYDSNPPPYPDLPS